MSPPRPLVDLQACVAKGMIIISFRLQTRIIQKEICIANTAELINSPSQLVSHLCSQAGWLEAKRLGFPNIDEV